MTRVTMTRVTMTRVTMTMVTMNGWLTLHFWFRIASLFHTIPFLLCSLAVPEQQERLVLSTMLRMVIFYQCWFWFVCGFPTCNSSRHKSAGRSLPLCSPDVRELESCAAQGCWCCQCCRCCRLMGRVWWPPACWSSRWVEVWFCPRRSISHLLTAVALHTGFNGGKVVS